MAEDRVDGPAARTCIGQRVHRSVVDRRVHRVDADLISGVTGELTEVWIDLTELGIEVRRPSDERLLYFASNLEPFSRDVRPDRAELWASRHSADRAGGGEHRSDPDGVAELGHLDRAALHATLPNRRNESGGLTVDDGRSEEVAGAKAYEALHVPALFEEWTSRVLDAAEVTDGNRVLDVACGTGVLARAAAKRVGASGSVVGVDPHPGMLAVAAQLEGEIDWRRGTAEALPCEDSSFDRVLSQFGMMFFVDRGRAVEEMLRVLCPGGHLAIAVWDSIDNSPAYSRAVKLLDRMAGAAAADALRAPFSMGNRSELKTLVEEAGATAIEGITPMGRASFPSVRSMVEADLRGWLPVMGVELEEDLIEAILAEAEGELAELVSAEGRVEFDSPAHILSAKKRQ